MEKKIISKCSISKKCKTWRFLLGDRSKWCLWSTNAEDSTAPNKITSTHRYAPTLFAYEDIDPSNGISDGYSDAKITTYNLSTTGTKTYLTDEQRSLYSYEYYNENPGLKVIYNYRTGF